MTQRDRMPGRRPGGRRLLLAAGALAAAGALLAGAALASADTPPPPPPAGDPADIPPPAVEDFEYPGASAISGITLKRGDGHIVLADCAGPTQIQVWSRAAVNPFGRFCFRATGNSGYLTVELPDVYVLQTTGAALSAKVTVEGVTQPVDLAKEDFRALGEGTSQKPTTLVELRTTL
ncbi:hypothetical protein ACFCX4_35805 [Kitasatospora sp. NPDC056327]|uniref:hypothetical protein n=1 Tax=Kitasatospora sp. NPDC056327 TaxID=3345785 RepID=UPI0035DD406B